MLSIVLKNLVLFGKLILKKPRLCIENVVHSLTKLNHLYQITLDPLSTNNHPKC